MSFSGNTRPKTHLQSFLVASEPKVGICAQALSNADASVQNTHLHLWGIDLKPALKEINAHFLSFPQEVREKGLMSFADAPPSGNRAAELWDRHVRKGYRDQPKTKMSPEKEAELVKRFKAFRKQRTLDPNDPEQGEDEMISVARRVHRKRGSWWQIPKDMPDPKDDEED